MPLVGMAVGVRIYPRTPVAKAIANGLIKNGLHPNIRQTPHEPIFYLSPPLGDDAFTLIQELVKGDPRFLLLSAPAEKGSYNYADDEALC